MNKVNVQFIKRSSNSKIGKIPATNSSRNTCPDNCSLKGGACYAECGFYTRLNWDKVDSGERGGDWSALCESVSKLKDGQLWRHNVSGDLPHKGEKIHPVLMADLVEANKGKRGFTYTHHAVLGDSDIAMHNRNQVFRANKRGFTVNLSADNPQQAVELKALNIAPVVAVCPANQTENFTVDGVKFVVCPAAVRDDIACSDCQLCQRQRDVVIAFPAHGTKKNQIKFN